MWEPIETAPKDGTCVFLRSPSHSPSGPFFWKRGRWETILFAVARSVPAWWDENAEQPTEWRAT